jgi:hypothetical protein
MIYNSPVLSRAVYPYPFPRYRNAIPELLKRGFDKVVLEKAKPLLLFDKFAGIKKSMNYKVKFRRYNSI